MANKTQLETLWNVPDELWALIAPVLGPEKGAGTVGRPARSNRQIFDGILFRAAHGLSVARPSPQAVWAWIHRAHAVHETRFSVRARDAPSSNLVYDGGPSPYPDW